MPATGSAPLSGVNLMDLLVDAVCVVDEGGHFLYLNAAAERIFGYAPDELIGRQMLDLVHPADRQRTLDAVDEVVADNHKPCFENRYVRKDGTIAHIMWTARWSPVDRVRVAVARDVTERRHAESMKAALYSVAEAAYGAPDLPTLFDRVHRIIAELLPASGCAFALHDRTNNALSFPFHVDVLDPPPGPGRLEDRQPWADVIHGSRALLVRRDAREDGGGPGGEWLGVPLVTPDGVIGVLAVSHCDGAQRYAQADIDLLNFVSKQVAAAIERKQIETRLLHIASHDPLTDLPNRSLVSDRLAQAIARARRDHSGLSLLYLDLDRFKPINDSHGHAVGDGLLQQVGLRLQHGVRETDTVGRMAGDEFVVLLSAVQSSADARRVAEKIRVALGAEYEVAGHRLSTSPSIGLAHYRGAGDDADQLIRRADAAMYRAKHDGGNRIVSDDDLLPELPPAPPARPPARRRKARTLQDAA